MPATTTTPVRIEPEAETFAITHGFRNELDDMIERVKHHVPDLREIEVALIDAVEPEGGEEHRVMIWAVVRSDPGSTRPDRDWDRWAVGALAPDVLRHVCMDMTLDGPAHGR